MKSCSESGSVLTAVCLFVFFSACEQDSPKSYLLKRDVKLQPTTNQDEKLLLDFGEIWGLDMLYWPEKSIAFWKVRVMFGR